jgi:hypothetical protein
MDHSLLDKLLKAKELYFCWTLKTIESRNSIIRAQNPAPGQGRWMKYCGIITRYNSLWRTTECGSEHQLVLVHTSWCSEEPIENKFSQATVGVFKHWFWSQELYDGCTNLLRVAEIITYSISLGKKKMFCSLQSFSHIAIWEPLM